MLGARGGREASASLRSGRVIAGVFFVSKRRFFEMNSGETEIKDGSERERRGFTYSEEMSFLIQNAATYQPTTRLSIQTDDVMKLVQQTSLGHSRVVCWSSTQSLRTRENFDHRCETFEEHLLSTRFSLGTEIERDDTGRDGQT